MYSQAGFHKELAGDRQRQLHRSASLLEPAASHLIQLRASERAELAAARRQALRYQPKRHSMFAAIRRHLHTAHLHPHGV